MPEWIAGLAAVNAWVTPATKSLAIAAYLATGVILLIAVVRPARADPILMRRAWDRGRVTVVVLASMLVLRYALDANYTLLATVAVLAVWFGVFSRIRRRPVVDAALVPAAVVSVVVTSAWWMLREGPADWARAAACVACTVLVFGVLIRRGSVARAPGVLLWCLFLVAVVVTLVDMSSITASGFALEDMASHWTAYIGQAEQVLAGLVPLVDLPMKHGPGPTSLTVAGCLSALGCWSGLRLIIVVVNLATWVLMLDMALAVSRPRSRVWFWAVALVMGAAMVVWPGAPYVGVAPYLEPSATGFRMLPLVLLAHQVFMNRPRAAGVAFVIAVAWSIETAVWAMVVYGLSEASRVGLTRAAVRVASFVAGTTGVLAVAFRARFGVWPDPRSVIEDLIVIPGTQDVLPLSSLLLLAASLGFGVWLVWHARPEPLERRRDIVAVSLWFATASYYLAAGHNNNLCAMFGFLALVGFRGLDRADADGTPRVTWALAAGQAALVASLAFSTWELIPSRRPLQVSLAPTLRAMSALSPDIDAIRARIGPSGGVGIAAFATVRRDVRETVVWTQLDPYELWGAMSSGRRRVYVQRSAARLGRPGWAILASDQSNLLADLQAAYEVTESWEFVGAQAAPDEPAPVYRVVKLRPK